MRSRERNISLYFTFLDFKKAYHSVDRTELIKVLIKYKINPKIIELIVQIYAADRTELIKVMIKYRDNQRAGGVYHKIVYEAEVV